MSHKQKHDAIKKSQTREKRHDRRKTEELCHRPILNEDKIPSHTHCFPMGRMEYNI